MDFLCFFRHKKEGIVVLGYEYYVIPQPLSNMVIAHMRNNLHESWETAKKKWRSHFNDKRAEARKVSVVSFCAFSAINLRRWTTSTILCLFCALSVHMFAGEVHKAQVWGDLQDVLGRLKPQDVRHRRACATGRNWGREICEYSVNKLWIIDYSYLRNCAETVY